MDIEKLATSAVVTEISKTDNLSGFINSGDKEPCWDGHIYIHEDKRRTKNNIKKVPVQVKGKLVSTTRTKGEIKYKIDIQDLQAYMMNGGAVFFVVYLDQKTGETIQIYYTVLLPIRIKALLEATKPSYQVVLRKFPKDNYEKVELFLNFYENAKKQASFAGKTLPTIDELSKQGILKSLSISYTGFGQNLRLKDFPKVVDGKSLTVYANVKGGVAPIPVEYYEEIHQVMMRHEQNLPITVNGVEFYDKYRVITSATNVELCIGSCVKLVMPNDDGKGKTIPVEINIRIRGTLKERIKGMDFILAIGAHGSFQIGEHPFRINVNNPNWKRIQEQDIRGTVELYRKVDHVLTSMNVKKDLDVHQCTEEDLNSLGFIVEHFEKEQIPEPGQHSRITWSKIKVGNLYLAILYWKDQKGNYIVRDFFGARFHTTWHLNDGDPITISQYYSLSADDFLRLDNLNLQMVVDDYSSLEHSDDVFELGNQTMLEILKAYDKDPRPEFLDAAKQLHGWLASNPMRAADDVTTINGLQIALRERNLSFAEKIKLYEISNSTKDVGCKAGALLLLGEQEEAEKVIASLDKMERETFESFPIYRFYKRPEEELKNG